MTDTAAALVIQLSADFKDFKKQMQNATGVFDAEGRKIEKRQAQLKRNLSNWAVDFSGLGGLNKALIGLTAGAVVGGLADLVKHSLDAASAIGDTAQQAGVGVEKLQELRFAATQSGASFADMDEGLTTLNKNLGDFVNTGAGRAAAAFKQLGIDKLIRSGDVRDASELFDTIVAKIGKVGSESQRSALLAQLFGKEAGPKLLQLVEQGAQGLSDLEAKAVSLGIVLSTQTVQGAKEASDRLGALFEVMKAEGVAAVSNLAPQIGELAKEITAALPDLITWAEKWADFFGIIRLSPLQRLQQQISDVDSQIEGLLKKQADPDLLTRVGDKLNGGAFTKQISDQIDTLLAKRGDLQNQILQANANAPGVPAAGQPRKTALHPAESDADKSLRLRRAQLLAQTGVDAATAKAALLVSQDETNVALLKGSADYYAAVNKQINDEFNTKVTVATAEAEKQRASLAKQGTDWAGYAQGVVNINQAMNDKIAAADEERKQKQFEAGPGGLLQQAKIASEDQIKSYQDETASIGLTAGELARLTFIQQAYNAAKEKGLVDSKGNLALKPEEIQKIKDEADAVAQAAQSAHDAQEAMQANIEVTDGVRTGLEDIGVAALKGFGSMKEAAANALEQVAELILRLYVLKPLVESVLGPAGTAGGDSGGGGFIQVIGKIIGSLFADGGVFVPGQGKRALKRFAGGGVSNNAAIFGEAGPEAAIPLPDGRSVPVTLRMPKMIAPTTNSGAPYLHFDLRGAVVTQDLLDQMNTIADSVSRDNATKAVSAYDRHVIPGRFRTLARNPRQGH